MDLRVGDPCLTIQPAFNPDNETEILYPVGTRVVIEDIRDDEILLRYPDGFHVVVSKRYVFQVCHPDRDVTTCVNIKTGIGTPPITKSLVDFLPKEMDWTKNYRWTISIELEEREPKEQICPSCLSDILKDAEKSDEGLLRCNTCDNFVPAINPQTFEWSQLVNHGK